MCHFHQKRIIQRYITKYPKLQANKDLQKILFRLTSTNETYQYFLAEKTLNKVTGKESFTHAKLVSAEELPLEGIEVYKQICLTYLPTKTTNI